MDTYGQAMFGVNGWLPNGIKVFYNIPIRSPETAFDDALAFTNALLAKGFVQTEPGLGQGEHKELIGSVSRRNKKNTDGSITPAIDLYAAAAHLKHRYMGVYLNTPEQIQAFENASGLKLESIPVNKAKAPAERDDEELIVRVKKPLTVVYSNNPDYDETSDDKKPKRLFERWEGQSNVLPLDTSVNGTQTNEKATPSDLGILDHPDYQPAQKTPAERLGTPSGQRIGADKPFVYDRIKLFMEVGKDLIEVPTPERNNTIIKMEGEGAFTTATSYRECVDLVIERINSPEHGKSKKASA